MIKVVERVNGKRVYREFLSDHHFYISDPRGTYKSIYGDNLKKITPHTFTEKQKILKTLSHNVRTWETDVDSNFRCLEQNYLNIDPPKLHVAFFDIETSFNKESGWSDAADADNFITAISIHLQWIDEIICLAIPPETLTWEEAQVMADEVGNVVLFKSEGEMLQAFIQIIDDADVLSGWNCIDKEEFVFLENRISKLKNISIDDTLDDGIKVTNVFNSGKKQKQILKTVFGKEINMSNEHIIPYFYKDKSQYKYLSTLKKNTGEGSILHIKNLLETKDVYIKQKVRSNNNVALTYGVLFDLIKNQQLRTEITGDDAHLYFNSKIKKKINRSDIISNDILQLLGFIFTDGHFSNYDGEWGFCNHNESVFSAYINILNSEGLCRPRDTTNKIYTRKKDGCFYSRFSKNNKFSILEPLIYTQNKKFINVELLSLLSEDQFIAFLSGMIDGDGSVSPYHIEICNFENQIKNIEILLTWNGLVCTTSDNVVRIKFLDFCMTRLSKIRLFHSERVAAFIKIVPYKKNNSPNKILNWFYDADNSELLIKIDSIVSTDEFIEMGDIETKTHYFNCNGITVHNCEAYDIPYVVNRIRKVLGKHETRKLCLWEQEPKVREYDRGGKKCQTYDLIGRIHVDYMQLYKKYNYEERHSYALNAIAEAELGDHKIEYEGTLDELYNDDFRTFLEYNIQDTRLLDKLDKKLQFLDLANSIAHANCVLIPTTMGTVGQVDQAIIVQAHSQGLICPDKKHIKGDGTKAAGGWVATPKKGLHKWLASTDMKSLYPSVIRALNMSPETIVGQIRLTRTNAEIAAWEALGGTKHTFAAWWNDKFNVLEMEEFYNQDIGTKLILDLEDGSEYEVTGKELHELVFESGKPWCISANGTIFRTDKDGIIPSLLGRWYSERKALQKTADNVNKIISGLELPDDLKDMF